MTVFTNYAFPASLSGAVPRTAPARASELFNVKEFGAVGDGTTNDTAAMLAAGSAAAAATNVNGVKGVLYFPGGTYVFNGGFPTWTVPVCVRGDGQQQSIILTPANFSGDTFSWSECWSKSNYSSGVVTQPVSGNVEIQGISIFGNTSGSTQNAFMFYDRMDYVYMRDVAAYNINGRALAFGTTLKNTIQSYVRESHFHDVRFWYCGTATLPVIELGTIGNGDRTNTNYWSGIDIFQGAGDGLVMRSTATNNLAADLQRFNYLRIENCAGNAIKLGDAGYTGRVNTNTFDQVTIISVPTGKYGIALYNNANANLNYENRFTNGHIGNSVNGINIVGARDFSWEGNIDVSGVSVTVGPTSGGSGGSLVFNGHNAEASWTWSVDASAVSNIFTSPTPGRTASANAPSVMAFAGGVSIGNGTADCAPAFVAAFAALSAPGGTLYVPPGTYNFVTGALTPPSNVVVQGAGIDATILKSTGTFPNNVTIQIPMTLTGSPWPSGPTTYPINAPTLGATTVTTTTAANAGNFSAGQIIFITGDLHSTSFWYPGWYTTVVSANATTGVITLAETLPLGGAQLTTVQKIVSLPQNISVRDMTIISGSTAAIECQGGRNFLFENLKVIPGSGGVTTADVTFGIHRNSVLRNIRMEQGANPLEIFVSSECTVESCDLFNSYILIDGGSFDCNVLNNNIKDPQNNGASFHGIHIPEYAVRNRIIGNSITGIPNAFYGINVSASVDSNRNHLLIGNTLVGATGSGGSAGGIATSDGIVADNFFSNLGSAIQLQSTESPIIEGNYFDLANPNGNNINPFSGGSFFRTVQEGNIRSMTSGTTTPSVAGHTSYTLGQGGAQNVSNFTGAKAGDVIRVATTDANTTFVSGSGITMKGGANYNAPANTVLTFMALTGTTWIEVSRSQ